MRRKNRLRLAAIAAFVALVASSCYLEDVYEAAENGDPVPWFCDPLPTNNVTGLGSGNINWYEGTTRSALSFEDCGTLSLQLQAAQNYASLYPTRGDAEAAGFFETFRRIPGMGTHHGLGVLTPEDFQDPNFDPQNPYAAFDGNSAPGEVDDQFHASHPEFLQYDGNGPDAPLVGMSYYVYTDTGLPPEGFAGNNDWWHHHPRLCHNPATAVADRGVNLSDAQCEANGGVNVHLQDFYMLHAWVVPDLELHSDVYAPLHGCILGSSAIFDMDHPCHDLVVGGATVPGADPDEGLFCPIGLIGTEAAPIEPL